MKVEYCPLKGLILIRPKVFADPRGCFLETWNRLRYAEVGIESDFVQDNVSYSRRGTLRGLHFQNPNPQAKLVSVLEGLVFDVAVDIRLGSPTFGQWHGEMLTYENKHQLFIPVGFAHGFLVLSETALFQYKCAGYYSPKDERAIHYKDPALGIQWPLPDPILSEKDGRAPKLSELPQDQLFR